MIKLSKSKNRALSQLSIGFSAVFLASLVLPAIIQFDKSSWIVVVFGLIGTIIFSFLALEFAERGKL